MKAMSILRKCSMVPQKPFTGSFDANCLSNADPELLFTSMNMLLQGSKDSLEGLGNDVNMSQRTKAPLSLSQLIIYNMVKHTPSKNINYMRHPKEYETSVPLYWGIRMHSEQRVKATLDDGSDMGLFVNSQRVCEFKVQVARAVSKRIKEGGVVVPTNMRKNVFTTCDCDNLDHLKRCNLSNVMFNGSLLTFTNHLSKDNMGQRRDPIVIDPFDKSKPSLPDDYVMVPPCELPKSDVYVPRYHGENVRPKLDRIEGALIRERVWIDSVKAALAKEELGDGDMVTWAGNFSQQQEIDSIRPQAEIGISPVFPNKITEPALLAHIM